MAVPTAKKVITAARIIRFIRRLLLEGTHKQVYAAALAEALKTHGWISGGNVQIDYRWGAGDGVLRHLCSDISLESAVRASQF
jgi:hypothetical protein